jgi:hypothetical protein
VSITRWFLRNRSRFRIRPLERMAFMKIASTKIVLFLPSELIRFVCACCACAEDAGSCGCAPIRGPSGQRLAAVRDYRDRGRAGSNEVAVASASTFRNNDGIVIYGAGATPAVRAAPGAPYVMAGISETETPDARMTPLKTGRATYSYSIVARYLHGGLSAASPITDRHSRR